MHSQKTKIFPHGTFLAVFALGACLILSSCATCIPSQNATELQKFYFDFNKNSEQLKNKSLNEIDPEFFTPGSTITVHILSYDALISGVVGGNVDMFSTVKTAVLGGVLPVLIMGPERTTDALFQDKINNLIKSYNWTMRDYFIENLKKKIDLPKEASVLFVVEEGSSPASLKTSDKDIIILVNMYMFGGRSGWGEPGTPLTGMATVTLASGETIQSFIKKYDGLPISAGSFLWPTGKTKLHPELRRIKIYPDMYMGSVTKHTDSHAKSKWMQDDGVFLEQQIKATLDDLAGGIAELIKKKNSK
ncbi:MAG: hypothetical protein PHV55_04000 [Candidatus Omnitrophica bacterium]|nr:hypothetical protein [Candidatus Omnitrophota bacterium]